MRQAVNFIIGGAVIVGMIAASIWWMTVQWQECRSAGFSVLYCIQHVL